MAQLKWPGGAQDIFSSVAADAGGRFPHPLGARGEDIFGREYRYCIAGVVDLVVGNCIQAAAQQANHQDLTPAAGAIGDKVITATSAATAAAAGDYAYGIAVIDTTPGLGFSYPINGHDLWTSGAVANGVVLQLMAGWSIQVAITNANSRVSLYANPFSRVIQSPITTLTNVIVGVCQFIISANQGGWIGRRGQFGTLIQGTPAVANAVSCPASAAGAVAINSGTLQIVGTMMDTGQDGKCEGVMWML